MWLGKLRRLSVLFLIGSNLVPIFGVLYWDWDVASLLMLYWSENLIIGVMTIIKMISRSPIGGTLQSIFFTVHYGGFCGGHGLFLLVLLKHEHFSPHHDWPFVFVFVELLVDVVRKVFEIAPAEWIIGFCALFISHSASLIQNYFLGGERERVDSKQLMTAPYRRIVVLHLAVIFGGMGVMALGSPLPLLLVLIAGKIALDVNTHLRERRNSMSQAPTYIASQSTLDQVRG